MTEKKNLRTSFKKLRNNLDLDYRLSADSTIESKLLLLPEIQSAKTISTYVSYRSEVNTHFLIERLLKKGVNVVIPKIVNLNILFHSISSLEDIQMERDQFPVPVDTAPQVNTSNIDVVLVPGLAFDVQGYRLGYGGGYYDKFLADYTGVSIGLCYTDQLVYEIPHVLNDMPVSQVITDTISIACIQ